MHTVNLILSIFSEIQTLVSSDDFLNAYRKDKRFFTRSRKVDFQDIINYILSIPRKNLSIDLEEYISKNPSITAKKYSKQAFSKARMKIGWEAFEEIFHTSVKTTFNNLNLNLWHGFQILAIDGTRIQVPQTKDNYYNFGDNNGMALALASTITDVTNDLIVDAVIGGCKDVEIYQALSLVKHYSKHHSNTNSIMVFDRGYNNYPLIELLCDNDQKFVMRCKKNFPSVFTKNGKKNPILNLTGRGLKNPRKLRRYTIMLDNGSEEYLLTNITDCKFAFLMKELYNLRWGVEKKYDELKNRHSIECFTGHVQDNIYQDFFATLLFSNISCIIKKHCDLFSNEKKRKRTYQTNKSNLIQRLKNIYIELLLGFRYRKKKLINIIEKSKTDRSPIRPNRKRERSVKHPKAKHHYNKKTHL